jgi:hypothetical protein
MAPNKSFGIKCSICSACVVSAMIDPIIKAPRAGENPTLEAKITIIRQSASEIINIISSSVNVWLFFGRGNEKSMTNQIVRKKISFSTDNTNSIPEN